MALFGRNKDEEFEDADEFDDSSYAEPDTSRYAPEGRERFSKRRFRDLNPRNRKKRKEPPKPWGRKERMIVLLILVVSVVVSAVLAIGARNKNTFRLSLPNFDINSLNIFKEETIVVEKSH